MTFIASRKSVSRRRFLQGAGIALSLPLLDSMTPAFAAAAKAVGPGSPDAKPRRFFGICNNLGLVPDQFFPTQTGRDYQL